MVEAFPALAPVLVQHESMADNGSALQGGNRVKSVMIHLTITVHRYQRTVAVSTFPRMTS